jgi:DNA-binding MarR family transcriptional regulator
MDAASQDPVAAIEQALHALRHSRTGRRGPGGPPWFRGGPHPGDPAAMHHGRGGPHEGRLAGVARIRMLGALREREPMSVSEIAETIGVDQPRASRLVNDATERGLVTRRTDDRDARRSVVQLAPAGRALLEASEADRRSAVAEALAGFSAEDAAELAALLTRFAAGMRSAREA